MEGARDSEDGEEGSSRMWEGERKERQGEEQGRRRKILGWRATKLLKVPWQYIFTMVCAIVQPVATPPVWANPIGKFFEIGYV